MRKSYLSLFMGLVFIAISFIKCADNKQSQSANEPAAGVEKKQFGGYETKEKWGEHLVSIAGCNDCHTPKIMTPQGPVDDSSLMLSGHPASLPAPDVDRKQAESKGLVITSDFTAWIGPWGISYSANLTPHETGTGNWTERQFINAIRNSISKGITGSRPLMPPMSMMPVKHMTDDELKAIFAYLRTIKPVENNSVQPTPPLLAAKH